MAANAVRFQCQVAIGPKLLVSKLSRRPFTHFQMHNYKLLRCWKVQYQCLQFPLAFPIGATLTPPTRRIPMDRRSEEHTSELQSLV